MVRLRPELRAPAARRDAFALSTALEKLIDERQATLDDRQAAYDAICAWKTDTAEYAYARASLAGRLAQLKGVTAIALVRDMESWGHLSMKLEPHWHEGAARRMLGTMYVLAPGTLVQHGNSEDGLELLEKQAKEYPNEPANRVRLAEGYITLNDPEPATPHLCFALRHESALRPTDQTLLEALTEQLGGRAKLGCP